MIFVFVEYLKIAIKHDIQLGFSISISDKTN